MKLEREPRKPGDRDWVTLTMEAPLWMGILSVVLSLATVVLLWVIATS